LFKTAAHGESQQKQKIAKLFTIKPSSVNIGQHPEQTVKVILYVIIAVFSTTGGVNIK